VIQHPGPWSALVTLPLASTGETVLRVLQLEQMVLEWESTFETLPAFNRLLVTGNPADWDPIRVELKLAQLAASAVSRPLPAAPTAKTVTLPACYDIEVAPDLAEVAAKARMSNTDLARLHVDGAYTVLATGFAPGFAYLGDVAPAIAVPRRSVPRQSVPAGSIGLADQRTGVYPSASPGGWRLIGRVPPSLFADAHERLTRFSPGQAVRFRAISLKDFEREA
jgi:inhibitor of KinA